MNCTQAALSFKRRLLMVAGLWLAGLILGSAMFLITDYADRRYYLLAVLLFPAGLYVPFDIQNQTLARILVGSVWLFYVAGSGWLLTVKKARIFWTGLGVVGIIVVVNIGGCAYGLHH